MSVPTVSITGDYNNPSIVTGDYNTVSSDDSKALDTSSVDVNSAIASNSVIAGLVADNNSRKQEIIDEAAAAAAAAATAAADAAAAEQINQAKINLLPVLDLSGSLHGVADESQVKIIAEFGDSRALVLNIYNDVITVDNVTDELYIMRFGDYKDGKFVALESPQKKVLLNKNSFVGFEPLKSGYGVQMALFGPGLVNDKPVHSVALRHYPAGEAGTNAVTKLFVSTEYALYAWDYDDSTKFNAFNSPLSNGQILVNRITCGIDTGYDYGANGHTAHDLLFNSVGDLHISSGSFGNIDIDLSGNLTDERATVKYVTDAQLKSLFTNPDSEPLAYDSSTVALLARGLRNACGLALDANDEVWCVNMGFDSVEISGVVAPNNEVLWDSNPADVVFKLERDNSHKKYGFPFAFNSATDLSVNGLHVTKNSQLIPNITKTEAVNDALGRPIGPYINRFSDASINDPSLFIQTANVVFEKSSSPLQIVFNSEHPNQVGKLVYDGRSDKRLTKTKSLDGDFALITLKGSWNRLRGSDGAGFKVVSMATDTQAISDVYYNSTFSSGWNDYSGLDNSGNPLGDLVAPSVYRPTGVVLDQSGTILVGSNYLYMSPPNRGGTIVAIY